MKFEPYNAEGLDLNNFIEEDQSNFLLHWIRKKVADKPVKNLTGCVRPLIFVGAKKRAYQECLAKYNAQIADDKSRAASADQRVAEAEDIAAQAMSQIQEGGARNASSEDGKLLGMPTGVAIAVFIVGGLVVAFVGYKVVKAMSTPSAAPVA